MATVPTALAGRHLLKELDLTEEEFRGLVELAAELKAAKRAGTETRYLTGRNIALIFEKTSTRTRCAFEVA
ncbi:ornithine carbamoyltransferase subunit F, partial [Streptomyces ardesiacus]